MTRRVWPGKPYPLGATWDGNGTNFAIYAENAEKVELCLFDTADPMKATKENERIVIQDSTDLVWHVYLPDSSSGAIVRLPRLRTLRSGQGAPLQSE